MVLVDIDKISHPSSTSNTSVTSYDTKPMTSIPVRQIDDKNFINANTLSRLDNQMDGLLNHGDDISDHDRWMLYNQTLQRFQHFANQQRESDVKTVRANPLKRENGIESSADRKEFFGNLFKQTHRNYSPAETPFKTPMQLRTPRHQELALRYANTLTPTQTPTRMSSTHRRATPLPSTPGPSTSQPLPIDHSTPQQLATAPSNLFAAHSTPGPSTVRQTPRSASPVFTPSGGLIEPEGEVDDMSYDDDDDDDPYLDMDVDPKRARKGIKRMYHHTPRDGRSWNTPYDVKTRNKQLRRSMVMLRSNTTEDTLNKWLPADLKK